MFGRRRDDDAMTTLETPAPDDVFCSSPFPGIAKGAILSRLRLVRALPAPAS
jgi:hypothetical protein